MRAASTAQEAAHPCRHACASVLHRGRPARSARVFRLLAQGHRQRRDGRAAGEARHPQGRRRRSNGAHEHEWPLARTQWTKFYLDLSEPAAGTGREHRRPRRGQSGEDRRAHLFRERLCAKAARPPRPRPSSRGRACSPAWAISLDTPPLAAGHRDHRAGRRGAVGIERDRGHGSVPHAPQHRCRRQRGVGDRPAGRAGAGRERLAARLAPRARSGAVAAVSAVSQAQAAAVSHARRNREGGGRDLADLDGVQERPPHPARHPAARRRRQPVHYMHYHADYNTGTNTIYAGGDKESYLLLPVIPAAGRLRKTARDGETIHDPNQSLHPRPPWLRCCCARTCSPG